MQSLQARQPGEACQADVGHTGTVAERDALERIHPRQEFGRAVGNPGVTGEIVSESGQPNQMLGRGIAGFPAVHQNQRLKSLAVSNVAVSRVGYVHRHELPKGRKPRQLGHARIRYVLATDRQPTKRRHPREGREPFGLEVVTTAPPDIFDGLRLAERHESLVRCNGVLAAEEAESGHASDISHGSVRRVDGKPAKVRQPDKRR